MKLLRTWPANPPPGRAHVEDDAARLLVDGYDFTALGEAGDDVLLLEWDIAVSREDVATFAAAAAAHRDRIIVAPYRLYAEQGRPADVWAHRYWTAGRYHVGVGHVPTGAPWCNLFAFGMAYLPQSLIAAYLLARPGVPLNDRWFPEWHYEQVTQQVPIVWDVAPVHLNYSAAGVPL